MLADLRHCLQTGRALPIAGSRSTARHRPYDAGRSPARYVGGACAFVLLLVLFAVNTIGSGHGAAEHKRGVAGLETAAAVGGGTQPGGDARRREATAVLGLVKASTGKDVSRVTFVLAVPGGGPGDDADDPLDLPVWTAQRLDAAAGAYRREGCLLGGHCLVVLLSLASMNGPSPRYAADDGGHFVIESSAMMARLVGKHGLPQGDIVTDVQSWDTVQNAVQLRRTVSGLLALTRQPACLRAATAATAARAAAADRGSAAAAAAAAAIRVVVLTSDFHAARVRAALDWVWWLRESARPLATDGIEALHDSSCVAFRVEAVPSPGAFPDEQTREQRAEHERRAVEQIKANAAVVRSLPGLYAWLDLGGHQGLRTIGLPPGLRPKSWAASVLAKQRQGWVGRR